MNHDSQLVYELINCCHLLIASPHASPVWGRGAWRATKWPHCNTLQHTAIHCNTRQHTTTHCNTRQHTATHGNTLQHNATHCNTRGGPGEGGLWLTIFWGVWGGGECVWKCEDTYICIFLYIQCIRIRICTYICVCTYTMYVYIYMCIYMHIYIYMHEQLKM